MVEGDGMHQYILSIYLLQMFYRCNYLAIDDPMRIEAACVSHNLLW